MFRARAGQLAWGSPLRLSRGVMASAPSAHVASQESFNRLRQRVIPVEIALVDEAVDLRFGEFYPGPGGRRGSSARDLPSPLSWRWNGSRSLRLFRSRSELFRPWSLETNPRGFPRA
jgi:hypothetical protein